MVFYQPSLIKLKEVIVIFYPPKHFRAFSRVSIAFCIFLLLCLGLLELFPLYAQPPDYINQAGLQRTRVEVLANAMLVLEYRPASEHATAVAQIETALPMFRQEETILQQINASDIQLLVLQQKASYLAITTAAQTVINSSLKPVNPIQLSIVMNNRDTFRSLANQIVALLVAHANAINLNLFYMKTGIVLLLVVVGVVYWIVLEKRMRHVIQEEKNEKGSLEM